MAQEEIDRGARNPASGGVTLPSSVRRPARELSQTSTGSATGREERRQSRRILKSAPSFPLNPVGHGTTLPYALVRMALRSPKNRRVPSRRRPLASPNAIQAASESNIDLYQIANVLDLLCLRRRPSGRVRRSCMTVDGRVLRRSCVPSPTIIYLLADEDFEGTSARRDVPRLIPG